MAYILGGSTIKAPQSMSESNSTQHAEHQALSGDVSRDYFGSNKRTWVLEYKNIQKSDYDTINSLYQSYLSSGNALSWQVTETNNTVATTSVLVDLVERSFSVGGENYISDFNLVLKEA